VLSTLTHLANLLLPPTKLCKDSRIKLIDTDVRNGHTKSLISPGAGLLWLCYASAIEHYTLIAVVSLGVVDNAVSAAVCGRACESDWNIGRSQLCSRA
jgi:hypothetical protein